MSSPVPTEPQQRPSLAQNSGHADVDGAGEKCEWGDCQLTFRSLPDLVSHLSEDHIKWKRPTYTCEWRGCPRRGMAQQSRFALISHLRSHTGEKPYDCPHPECDKSFTRTDALVKHLRQQHGEPQKDANSGSPSQANNHHHASNGPNHHHDRHHHSSSQADEDPRRNRRAPSLYRHTPTLGDRDRDRDRASSSQQLKRRRSVSMDSHKGHSLISQSKRAKTLPSSLSRQKSSTILSSRGRPTSIDRPSSSHHSVRHSSSRRDHRLSPSVSETETDSDHGAHNGHRGRATSPRDVHAKYKLAKAKYLYISRENEMLVEEYEALRRKLRRLRIEKNVLLEAVYEMTGDPDNDDLDSSNYDSDLDGRPDDYDDDMDPEMLPQHASSRNRSPMLLTNSVPTTMHSSGSGAATGAATGAAAQQQPPVKGKRGGRRPGAGRKAGRKKEIDMGQSHSMQQQFLQQKKMLDDQRAAEADLVQVEDVKVEEGEVEMGSS